MKKELAKKIVRKCVPIEDERILTRVFGERDFSLSNKSYVNLLRGIRLSQKLIKEDDHTPPGLFYTYVHPNMHIWTICCAGGEFYVAFLCGAKHPDRAAYCLDSETIDRKREFPVSERRLRNLLYWLVRQYGNIQMDDDIDLVSH